MIRALLALEDFVDYFTMIIHESDFPLLHRCLLDKTHEWAYIYLDLGRRANVPASVLSSDAYISSRPCDGPDDQAQNRQQQDQQHPEDLHPGLGAAFEHVDDCPDVQGKNDQANQAIERGTHDDAPEEWYALIG
ncbi:hypothetical protein EMIT0P218_50231 [Pseudomonas sp. IT-P218]